MDIYGFIEKNSGEVINKQRISRTDLETIKNQAEQIKLEIFLGKENK